MHFLLTFSSGTRSINVKTFQIFQLSVIRLLFIIAPNTKQTQQASTTEKKRPKLIIS